MLLENPGMWDGTLQGGLLHFEMNVSYGADLCVVFADIVWVFLRCVLGKLWSGYVLGLHHCFKDLGCRVSRSLVALSVKVLFPVLFWGLVEASFGGVAFIPSAARA